jgi:hypothetical protein
MGLRYIKFSSALGNPFLLRVPEQAVRRYANNSKTKFAAFDSSLSGVSVANDCLNVVSSLSREGVPLPTRVTINPDRSYNLVIHHPTATYFLKQVMYEFEDQFIGMSFIRLPYVIFCKSGF